MCYYIILQLKHGFESTTKERENHGGRELGILFVIKRFIYVVFVHVLPSGYPNANEGDPDGWAAPSLVCILSTDNNLHFFLALCVSLDYETLALIRLRFGSSVFVRKKKFLPFRALDFHSFDFWFCFCKSHYSK